MLLESQARHTPCRDMALLHRSRLIVLIAIMWDASISVSSKRQAPSNWHPSVDDNSRNSSRNVSSGNDANALVFRHHVMVQHQDRGIKGAWSDSLLQSASCLIWNAASMWTIRYFGNLGWCQRMAPCLMHEVMLRRSVTNGHGLDRGIGKDKSPPCYGTPSVHLRGEGPQVHINFDVWTRIVPMGRVSHAAEPRAQGWAPTWRERLAGVSKGHQGRHHREVGKRFLDVPFPVEPPRWC